MARTAMAIISHRLRLAMRVRRGLTGWPLMNVRQCIQCRVVTSLTAVGSYPGPELYYYEVIECGRRILLTGVLIFISPNSATQAAMACIFAFASLLGFELMRPHMDPTDSWLYRLVSDDALVSALDSKHSLQRGGCSLAMRGVCLYVCTLVCL